MYISHKNWLKLRPSNTQVMFIAGFSTYFEVYIFWKGHKNWEKNPVFFDPTKYC